MSAAGQCGTCGAETDNLGTGRCNRCWEIESRLGGYLAQGGVEAQRQVFRFMGSRTEKGDLDFGAGVPGLIAEECYALRDMLHEKNRAYGNSALDPVRIFSKADPEEQLRVRLDDKLSRLARGSAAGEDVELDLLGYLILIRVARRLRGA